MDTSFFNGKTVVIMGLGRFGGGVDVALFTAKFAARVIVTDLANEIDLANSIEPLKGLDNVELHLGRHLEEDFAHCDIVIVNPAVTPDNRFLDIARDSKKLITSQIEIFFQLCPASVIGITGANGKSTTAALTAHLLKSALGKADISYTNVWLGGNIGNKPLLENLEQIKATDIVVLELSSFQLEQLAAIETSPDVALITNLAPNHLDRHGTFDNYCDAKENIFKYQKARNDSLAISIFNSEDPVTHSWFEKYSKDTNRKCLTFKADDVSEGLLQQFTLPGRANRSDLAAALAIARNFTLDDEDFKNSLSGFSTLPHRLELVADRQGVRWYNDSISTTPDSTMAAIEAFDEPKILIAGGYDKNLAFDMLGEKIARSVKAAILIGQTADKIAESARSISKSSTKVEIVSSLADAVKLASEIAENGDVVLLSPACASYDMFDNFVQRGEIFRRLVNEIS